MQVLSSLLRLTLYLAVLLLVVSYFMRDRFPEQSEVLGEMAPEPLQEAVEHEPIEIYKDDQNYTIEPQFSYELYGIVVSEHTTDAWYDFYHKRWGDTLNVKDVCVVWGENATTGVYSNMEYKSGSWTCYYKTNDAATWQAFSQNQLSNNHLLTSSIEVQRLLQQVRRGDQIRIKGYLSSYSHDDGFERGTSITRTDRGNGACETIFVTEVEVLKRANELWRDTFTLSLFLVVTISMLRLLLAAFFPKRSRGTVQRQD